MGRSGASPQSHQWLVPPVAAVICGFLIWTSIWLVARPVFERFEMQWLDALLAARLNAGLTEPLANRIQIVQVDDRDLVYSGTGGEYVASAKAIRQIADLGARVIALDVLYLHGSVEEQTIIVEAIKKVRAAGCRVVVAATLNPRADGTTELHRSLALAGLNDPEFGIVNMQIDPDRLWRRYAMTSRNGEKTYLSLALAAFKAGLPGGLPLQIGEYPGQMKWIEFSEDFSQSTEQKVDSQPVLINYRHSFFDNSLDARRGIGRRIWSLRDLADLSESISANGGRGSPLYGSTVFFGYGAGMDEKPTCMGGQEPGVFLHATALSDLIQEQSLRRLSPIVDFGTFLAIGILAFGLFRVLRRQWLFLVAGAVVGIGILASGIPLVWKANYVGAVVSATSLWTFLFVIESVRRSTVELVRRTRLDATMSRYFSRKVLEQIRDNRSAVEPREAELTVCLTDVRNFTRLTEELRPRDMFAILSKLFGFQTKAALAQDGSLQHFWGDQFIAYWGAPEPQPDAADRALAAVKSFLDDIKIFALAFQKETSVHLAIGVGLHRGPGLVGDMGSESYVDYNIFGDVVNVTARVESLSKRYGIPVVATREFYSALTNPPPMRLIDRVFVAGKRNVPVELIELHLEGSDLDEFQQLCAAYEQALKQYTEGRFQMAANAFGLVEQKFNDSASREMKLRCLELAAASPVPENWNGVFEFSEK